MKQLSLRGVFLMGALLGVFCLSAFAQEGTIVGTVTDPSGAAVPNVTIKVTNIDTGQVWRVATNATGDYVAPDLHIGHFLVRAEATGFKADERTNIVLTVGDRLRFDFKLALGTTTQNITVEAAPIAVQTDTGEVSAIINSNQITDLAMNGRSFYNLIALVPGSSSLQPDFQVPSSSDGNANVSFNGNRMVHNIWLLDGGEDADRGGGGGMSIMPSEDAIAEFRTLTSNYSADYGLSSAGTMTMVLKSGTKQFHATAWEFDRNDALNAVNAFQLTKTVMRFNVFGFNVGGPVALHESGTHKTFFFYNQEWRRYIKGGSLNATTPDPSTFDGQFPTDYTTTQLHVPCTNQVSGTIASQLEGAGLTLSTPDSSGNCAPPPTTPPAGYVPWVPQGFPGNMIPTGVLDPDAQLLVNSAKIFPTSTANLTTDKGMVDYFKGGGNTPTAVTEEIARIDHTFNDKFSIFGHWVSEQYQNTYLTTMWSGDSLPTVGNTYGNPSYSAVAHATYAISPTLINETAFNYNGNRIHILPTGSYTEPSGWASSRIFPGPDADNRLPSIYLHGATNAGYDANWVPWNNAADDYQIRDDISWVKGAHQLKIGGSWALYKKAQDVFGSTQGNFGFNGLFTGNDMADFLLGYAQSYSEAGVHDTGHWNNISPAAYFQDNWRVSKRLTLNLGLRWDGIPHTYEANNRYSDFYPNLYNTADAATFLANGSIDPNGPAAGALGTSPNSILAGYQFYLNGVRLAGQSGVPKGMVNPDWNAWGPRFGFAYDLTGSGKTVIRGGIGIMYERIQGNDMYDGGTDPPFSASVSLNNVSLSNAKLAVTTGTVTTIPPAPILAASFTGQELNYPAPRSTQFSLGVERQLGAKAVLSVAYVGTLNRHQSYFQEINNPADTPATLSALISNGNLYNSEVPYLGFHDVDMASNAENSHYNGLQVGLRGQVARDLTLQVAYTLSKQIDPGNLNNNGGDVSTDSNPYGWGYDVGPGIFDRRNVFATNFIYQIPILKHSSNHALKVGLGGWELSGIITAEDGAPLNITMGGTTQSSNGLPNAANRPDVVGSVGLPHSEGSWFSQSSFAAPALGAWGTASYDDVYGPGRDNWNLSLFKNFVISETRGSRLELRFESFNTFNHVQWNAVSSSFGNGNFGNVTGAADPRVFQLGAKLYF
ncbi:MAG: carboxypeptidase-like regulatory domain-containing protein [Terriglobia bacterium]